MPYPRYDERRTERGSGNYRSRNEVNPWLSGRGDNNYSSHNSGLSGLLPTPNGSGSVDMALAGKMIASLLGGASGGSNNNPLTMIASQLAATQALIGKDGGSGGYSMGYGGGGRGEYNAMMRDRDMSMRRNRGKDRSPPHRRNYRRSPSPRSRRFSTYKPRGPLARDSSPTRRPDFEIYVGNYPTRFESSEIRKLFEDKGIVVKAIRMKNDGVKSFSFVETISEDEINKAVELLDSKDFCGRRLRVRSAKDKEHKRKKPTPRTGGERVAKEEDATPYLVTAFISFLERVIKKDAEVENSTASELEEADKEVVIKNSSRENLIRDVIEKLRNIFKLYPPNCEGNVDDVVVEGVDDNAMEPYKVSRRLENLFFINHRRDIKLPPLEETENEEGDKNITTGTVEDEIDTEIELDEGSKRRESVEEDELDVIETHMETDGDMETGAEVQFVDEDQKITENSDADEDAAALVEQLADDDSVLDDKQETEVLETEVNISLKETADEDVMIADNEEVKSAEATPSAGRGRPNRARRSRGRR